MKPTTSVYMRPIFAGILGMIAAAIASKAYDHFFPSDRRSFNCAILVIPWLIATISAVNIGYRAGLEDRNNEK